MDWYEAIILGIVQGLTEWLPISSSGHLAIAEKALNLDYPVVYDVALHFGTLLGLLYYFKEDVKKIGMKIPSLISKIGKKDAKLEEERMMMMIIISGVMTSLIFVMASAFKIGQYKEKYGITDTEIVGVALVFNALILLASKEVENKRRYGFYKCPSQSWNFYWNSTRYSSFTRDIPFRIYYYGWNGYWIET